MTSSLKASYATPARPSFLVRHREAVLLLAFAFALFFFRLGAYPLFDLDEPRYAEAAREMLSRGDWITPYFNDELRFDKPVLFYWLVALAYQMFGVSEFAARFFSAVSATATVGLVYAFGKQVISRQYGFFAGVMLATSLMFIGIARMSITDMTLCAWMSATSLCLFLATYRDLRWWLAAGAFAGLAVLTKGPVGIVVPGAILVLYALLIGDFRRCLLNRWLPLAVLLAATVALPWYVLAYLQNGQIFLDALFLHNVTRFSDVVSGHNQPPYFFVLVILAGFLPWTPYLPAALRQLWVSRARHGQRVAAREPEYLVSLYSAVWAGFVFAFFTLGHTKLLTYILPLFPALALLIASVWHRQSLPAEGDGLPQSPWPWLTVPAWSWLLLCAVGGAVFITHMPGFLPREAAGVQGGPANAVAVLLVLGGALLTAWQLQKRKVLNALLMQALSISLLVIFSLQTIVPQISRASQGVMLDYLRKTDGKPLILYEIQRPSLTFYGRRRVPRFVEEEKPRLLQELNKNPQTCAITRNEFVAQFEDLLPPSFQVRVLEKGPVYSLLSISKAP